MIMSKPSKDTRALRICMLVPYDIAPQAGGVKQHAVALMRALQKRGDHVILAGPTSAAQLPKDCVGFPGVINIRGNGSDNRLGIFTSPWRIRRFLRTHKFDVMHLHEPQAPLLNYWMTWLGRKIPKVATFHAFSEQQEQDLARRLSAKLLFDRIQRGIAVSPAAALYAQQSWHKPLTLIPNGVAVDSFCPPESTTTTQRKYFRLLFVGPLHEPRKGARFLLEAFKKLRAKKLPIELHMVGKSDGSITLPASEHFFHYQNLSDPELVALFRQTDALVAPATGQESFGMILLEAMACQKPIISSAIEGYQHVAHPQGTLFVPPGNTDALCEAIEHLIAMPDTQREKMAKINYAHAQDYSWDLLAQKIRGQYLEAIDEAQSSREIQRLHA